LVSNFGDGKCTVVEAKCKKHQQQIMAFTSHNAMYVYIYDEREVYGTK